MVPSFLFTLRCYCFSIRGSGLFIGPQRLGVRPDDPNVKWLNKIDWNLPIGEITPVGGPIILRLSYCSNKLFPDSGCLVCPDTSLILVGNKVAEYPWDSVLVSVDGEVPEAKS